MPRRKPISNKQRKAELQFKRAVKRGDIPAPEATDNPSRKSQRGGRTTTGGSRMKSGPTGATSGSGINTRQLESRFMRLDKEWLEHARLVASTTPLPRPVPVNMAILDPNSFSTPTDQSELAAPKRPKWRYDQSKKEVEKNEEGLFSKWIKESDQIVQKWQESSVLEAKGDDRDNNDRSTADHNLTQFKRSPSYFERNLEVWRQLWRVTETSQILLILLDCRAPTLHFPPSLQKYLQTIRPSPQIILVLTKIDLVGPERASAWTEYLSNEHPGMRIVQVESYRERQVLNDGRGSRRFVDPYIPPTYLKNLVDAIKAAHHDLVHPPTEILQDEAKLKHWKPKAKENVNWDAIFHRTGTSTHAPPQQEEFNATTDKDVQVDFDQRCLTIGLIGQPNVGKSSLLNALFGSSRVRASRTPGKTKHFQTLYWTPEIRLVDCPGLVFPSLIPMELQVLAGILPISQMASIPSCIQFASTRMPLEKYLSLEHPSTRDKAVEDKRTWRPGMERSTEHSEGTTWTAMDVITSYATSKGWLTAKAGRPDVNRAGNAILRACADGRNIKWGFWPPRRHDNSVNDQNGDGLLISGDPGGSEGWEDDESGDDVDEQGQELFSNDDDIGDEARDEADEADTDTDGGTESDPAVFAGGRFRALSLLDNGDMDDSS